MSPQQQPRRRRSGGEPAPRARPSADDVHDIVFFQRHVDDDPAQSIPGREAINAWPPAIRAKIRTVLVAVAEAPPTKFAGGGKWEAMKGEMAGWFEVRADGPGRRHYRLFCRLDLDARNPDRAKPLLVVIAGLDKAFRTTLADADYAKVRRLGEEYLSRNPRSIA
jgi:hypothetical protein